VKQLGAILLAAGSSSRLGQSKQLLEIDGQTLVRIQASKLMALKPACVVVVTGAEQQAVEQALHDLPLQCLHNSNWQKGMGSSLACGIAAMPERVRGALLLLCDQWKITTPDLQGLVNAWQLAPGSAVTAQWTEASGQNASGPPVVFPRALFFSLARLHGDRGAQQILKHYSGGVTKVQMVNAGFDIDQESDLPLSTSPPFQNLA
jgi:molybdenum cofactor cytidylyltransferase